MAQQVGIVQQPQIQGQIHAQTPLLAERSSIGPSADGILRSTNSTGQSAEIWLGGIPPAVLHDYVPNTCLRVLSNGQAQAIVQLPQSGPTAITTVETTPLGREQPYVQVQSRHGLVATVELLTPGGVLQQGQSLQEAIRVLPRTLPFNVALGADLDRVERVDATSAFSSISNIAPVTADQPANCLFAKVPVTASTPPTEGNSDPPVTDKPVAAVDSSTLHSYGLCSLVGELLPNTRGEAGEAIKTAVRRLKSKLRLLWTAKLLSLTVNNQSSRLGMMVMLEAIEAGETKRLACQYTPRADQQLPEDLSQTVEDAAQIEGLVTLPAGSRIQYRLCNYSGRPLYWVLFGIDTDLNAFTFSLPDSTADTEGQALEQGRVAAGATLTLPSSADEWITHGPMGLATTYLVCSVAPFTHALTAMAAEMQTSVRNGAAVVTLAKPQEVGQAIVEDLHQASTSTVKAMGLTHESSWALDVDQWATFQFVHQVL